MARCRDVESLGKNDIPIVTIVRTAYRVIHSDYELIWRVNQQYRQWRIYERANNADASDDNHLVDGQKK